jgi:hypothetical protein
MALENDVLAASGCQQHNCAGNIYSLYIDFPNNNLNVFHFYSGKMEAFKEKGDIQLPAGLKKDFETTKENSKE